MMDVHVVHVYLSVLIVKHQVSISVHLLYDAQSRKNPNIALFYCCQHRWQLLPVQVQYIDRININWLIHTKNETKFNDDRVQKTKHHLTRVHVQNLYNYTAIYIKCTLTGPYYDTSFKIRTIVVSWESRAGNSESNAFNFIPSDTLNAINYMYMYARIQHMYMKFEKRNEYI